MHTSRTVAQQVIQTPGKGDITNQIKSIEPRVLELNFANRARFETTVQADIGRAMGVKTDLDFHRIAGEITSMRRKRQTSVFDCLLMLKPELRDSSETARTRVYRRVLAEISSR